MTQQASVCEEHTFKSLYNKHAQSICHFVYYKCGDMQQAEDITQDAFIKLWNNCKNVLLEKAKSYVMKIAQNAFLNETKHQKVVLKHKQNADISGIFIQSPDYILEEKEFLNKLQDCISKLAPKQREVFLLSRIDKKTYKEIAELVGITQKAVERRMGIALQELRKKLEMNI